MLPATSWAAARPSQPLHQQPHHAEEESDAALSTRPFLVPSQPEVAEQHSALVKAGAAAAAAAAEDVQQPCSSKLNQPRRLQFGLLDPMRRDVLPADPAFDPLRPLAALLFAPTDEMAYRRLVDELNAPPNGERIALELEAAVDRLHVDDVGAVYSVLTHLSQKYIHGVPEEPRHVLPRCLGRAWLRVSDRRGAPLTMTYDALVLTNWHLHDAEKAPTLDNIDGFVTVRGHDVERAFIRTHAAIEAAAGDLPGEMLRIGRAIMASHDGEEQLAMLNSFLKSAVPKMEEIAYILGSKFKVLRPPDYFNHVRMTLVGTSAAIFPDGVALESTDRIMERKGGSGGQSPVMIALDRFFAVDHIDPKLELTEMSCRQVRALRMLAAPPEHAREFIEEQVKYMCREHRDFFTELKRVPNARQLVLRFGNHESAVMYDRCIGALEKFRKVHKQVVHSYVGSFEKKAREQAERGEAVDAKNGGVHVTGAGRGAAGTYYNTMLPQLLAETTVSKLLNEPEFDGTGASNNKAATATSSPSTAAPPAAAAVPAPVRPAPAVAGEDPNRMCVVM